MDKVLKQRLVGASILIALAVIFLPMLFDGDAGDAGDQRELALDLPERPGDQRRIRRLALDPDEARRSESDAGRAEVPDERSEPIAGPADTAAEPARPELSAGDRGDERPDSAAPDAEETAPVEPASSGGGDGDRSASPEAGSTALRPADPEPEADPGPAAAPADAPEPETTSADFDDSWSVQVAVFSNRDTALSISERLADLGHQVGMDELVRDQAELYRLRTGPYVSRAQAEQARAQIRTTIAGVDPELRAPDGEVESAGEARSGLSAQVGSFASRNNAERLSGQLRAAGFDAFMHGEESGGQTIWRVRVGVFDERDEAERMLARLRDEEGLDGIVVSHP